MRRAASSSGVEEDDDGDDDDDDDDRADEVASELSVDAEASDVEEEVGDEDDVEEASGANVMCSAGGSSIGSGATIGDRALHRIS